MNTGALATNDLLGVSYGYDARLRMKSVGVGSLMNLTFQYPASNDNGNLAGQTILRGGNTIGTQSYAYDGVNRLTSAGEGAAWSQSFVYDPIGNRSAPNSGIT